MSKGFSAETRAVVVEREGGRCARCGWRRGAQLHHRRPRGMGGSNRPTTNAVANAVWLCLVCHSFIEANRTVAMRTGWLVDQHAEPADVPVPYRGFWVLLLGDGGIEPILNADGVALHGPPV